MPKVFRPTFKSSKPQEKTNDASILDSPSRTLPRSPSPTKTIKASSDKTESICITSISECPSTIKSEGISLTDLDSDQLLPTSKPIQAEFKKVDLFVPKKTRRNVMKTTEPLPSVDEPLDRSAVTLRSLLNWVPYNKPPPTYRQGFRNSPINDKNEVKNSVNEISIKSVEEDVKKPLQNSSNDEYFDPLAPQVRIDADGNIVLDEASLIVGKTSDVDTKNLRYVNEETGILGVTYSSFRPPRNNSRKRWSERETTRFYRALSTIGTDFYVMEKMFANRSRSELLRKFKREQRTNPYLINQALRNRRVYDLSNFLPSSDEEDEKLDLKSSEYIRKLYKKKTMDEESVNNDELVSQNSDVGIQRMRKKSARVKVNPQFEANLIETINAVLAEDNPNTPVNFKSQTCRPIVQANVNRLENKVVNLTTNKSTISNSVSISSNCSNLEKMITTKLAEITAAEQKHSTIENLESNESMETLSTSCSTSLNSYQDNNNNNNIDNNNNNNNDDDDNNPKTDTVILQSLGYELITLREDFLGET